MAYSLSSITRSFSSRASAPRSASRAAGFTLLEILVVLAIMGLLVGLAVTKVGGILSGGQEDIARLFVRSSLNTPLYSYKMHMGDFPSTAEGLQTLITPPATKAQEWRGPYIESSQLPLDPWKEPYNYRYPGTRNKNGYDLWSKGPDRQDNTPDDIGNWTATETPK